jgi:hypothetical protein
MNDQTFGPNVIRATLVSGRRRWRIVGGYIPPNEENGSTIDFIQAAAAVDSTLPLILLGDLRIKKGYRLGTMSANNRRTTLLPTSDFRTRISTNIFCNGRRLEIGLGMLFERVATSTVDVTIFSRLPSSTSNRIGSNTPDLARTAECFLEC